MTLLFVEFKSDYPISVFIFHLNVLAVIQYSSKHRGEQQLRKDKIKEWAGI